MRNAINSLGTGNVEVCFVLLELLQVRSTIFFKIKQCCGSGSVSFGLIRIHIIWPDPYKQKIIVLSIIVLIEEKKIVIFFDVKSDSDPLYPSPDPRIQIKFIRNTTLINQEPEPQTNYAALNKEKVRRPQPGCRGLQGTQGIF